MGKKKLLHIPVMVSEVLHYFAPVLKPQARILDMTFGTGGHLRKLMEAVPGMTAVALDRDPEAFARAQVMADKYQTLGSIKPLLGRFDQIEDLLQKELGLGGGSMDAVLIDCGCCSTQLDQPERGFGVSAGAQGPLDMRMDGNRLPGTITAADVLAHCPEKSLTRIFRVYGDERRAAVIARAIAESRYMQCVPRTCGDLAAFLETVLGSPHLPDAAKQGSNSNDANGSVGANESASCNENVATRSRSRHHLAARRPGHVGTRVFMALRIFVNDELNQLVAGLAAARRLLRPGGRLVAISFHSLEDRLVKQEMMSNMLNEMDPVWKQRETGVCVAIPATVAVQQGGAPQPEGGSVDVDNPVDLVGRWRRLTKKVVIPTDEEVGRNPRCRSAKLRAAELLVNE